MQRSPEPLPGRDWLRSIKAATFTGAISSVVAADQIKPPGPFAFLQLRRLAATTSISLKLIISEYREIINGALKFFYAFSL
jgi:hypothetical protein